MHFLLAPSALLWLFFWSAILFMRQPTTEEMLLPRIHEKQIVKAITQNETLSKDGVWYWGME